MLRIAVLDFSACRRFGSTLSFVAIGIACRYPDCHEGSSFWIYNDLAPRPKVDLLFLRRLSFLNTTRMPPGGLGAKGLPNCSDAGVHVQTGNPEKVFSFSCEDPVKENHGNPKQQPKKSSRGFSQRMAGRANRTPRQRKGIHQASRRPEPAAPRAAVGGGYQDLRFRGAEWQANAAAALRRQKPADRLPLHV